jgi:multidrug efflux pump subunit AcrA (membrane-fusion protein)
MKRIYRFVTTAHAVGAARIVLPLALVCALFGSCKRDAANAAGGPGGPGAAFEAPVFAVNTTAAVRGQIQDYLPLSGDIVAGSTVDAYSDVAGKVSRVYVSLGDRVTRNQAIAEVDPSRPGMTYMASVVRAPIAGTVVALPAQVGMTVSQQVPIARLAGGGALEIRLYVAERFISKMAVNLPCEITLDAWPGEIFQGSVYEVAPVVDPASRTMEVKVNVSNTGSRLKAGMFAKVRVITEQKQSIVKIPAGALIQRFGESYVYTAEPDPANPGSLIARKKTVVPGIKIDEVLEIQEGLSPDEDVVVRGYNQLVDGARINIIERVAPLSAN